MCNEGTGLVTITYLCMDEDRLRKWISVLPSFGAATDGSRSMAMPSLLRRSVLPPHLRCHGTEALELFEEQRDALTFHLGDSERAAVTAARLDFLSRTAIHTYVVDLSSSNQQAAGGAVP